MSHVGFFEARGIVYRDGGEARDPFSLLKSNGLTCVRLRVFTSSAAQAQVDPYNCINNLDYTVPLAVRVKNAGLQLLLDFHYSDTWADPGKQAKPSAWTNLNFNQLTQQVRSYTSNCIAAFGAAGAMPEYVQVGNEITSGMLWPDGEVGGSYDTPTQWTNLCRLLTNAIAGVRDAAGASMPKIIIHIDRGGDWAGTQWFFNNLQQRQVTYDIIGESYYPFWHGSPDSLTICLSNAAKQFGKPVLVAETAFPWANSTNIYGIPASPAGQVQFVALLAQIVTGVAGQKGAGIVWWGSEYQSLAGYNLAGFDRRSFFDANGNVLPVANAFGQLVAPVRLSASLAGANLDLRWPLSAAGWPLMTTSNLGPATSWSRVPNAAQSTGAVMHVTLPLNSSRSAFYRLQTN